MKVTVSFGDTKVVVPCGDGNMPVRDLVDKAMHRYRKSATAAVAAGILSGGETSPELPNIDYVKLARDNGILDWDDRVCDVLDDREMIVACLAPADLSSGFPHHPTTLSDHPRVPPLHGTNLGGGDSQGSASSPEFHTAPGSTALSAITARVRQGEGSGGGDAATGSLTTLGDTCSPGGSTSGASSSVPGHEPPGQVGKVGSGLQHHLGCPAATGGSEPALAPPRGLSRVVCCRKAYAGSSILVSGGTVIAAGSPPAGSRTTNNGLLSHRHQLHSGSLDSCANPVAAHQGQDGVGGGPGVKPQIASSGEHLHHHHQHPFLSNQPVHETHNFLAPKKHPDQINDISPSSNTTNRSPAMVAIHSDSSSDHDEDYPRLRREPIGRQSLGNNPSLLRWLDAQERLQHGTPDTEPSTQPLSLRIDPRNDSNSVEPPPGSSLLKTVGPRSAKELEAMGINNADNVAAMNRTILLKLRNQDKEQGGGLGIQVKPYYSPSPGPGLGSRVEAGLEIQRVVPGGRMAREGKLRAGDRIIEINGKSLNCVSFVRAQEMFRNAMRTPEIQLRVIPAEPVQSPPGNTSKSIPPPLLPKPNVSSPPLPPPPPPPPPLPPNNLNKRPAPLPPPDNEEDDDEEEDPWLDEEATFPATPNRSQQQQLAHAAAAIANAKKAPPPPQRSPMTHLSGVGSKNGSGDRRDGKRDEDDENSSRPTEDSHAISSSSPSSAGKGSGHQRSSSLGGSKKDLVNTKRPGVRHTIVLVKGKDGFGFSLTTRDTKTNGPNPILVKSILSRGSAIRDGQLRCGDRMLEVDGLDVTERTQKEVVQMLKSVAVGKNVQLTISRQEEEEVNGAQDMNQKGDDKKINLSTETNRSRFRLVTMQFDISLEDTELNGLGISVKGLSRESPSRTEEKDVTDGRDEGVYVKNVIRGGAAANDGRLEVNDQILEINGTSLRGLSNKQALARLRSAVQRGSKDSDTGCIRVVIARRQPISSSNSGDSSNHSMLISAEVHEQQSQPRSSKGRLARQPTRQQRIDDDDDGPEDEDDTPPLPPPPPMEEFESVSGCGTLEHHPVLSRLRAGRHGLHAPSTLHSAKHLLDQRKAFDVADECGCRRCAGDDLPETDDEKI